MGNKNAKPPEHTKWKKGQSGNPLGGKLHDPEVKMIKNLTKQELIEVGSLVVKGSLDDLKEMAKNGQNSVIKCMVAAVAARAISKGDSYALETLLNRLIGKVKDEIKHTGLPENAPQVVLTMPSNGREAPKK